MPDITNTLIVDSAHSELKKEYGSVDKLIFEVTNKYLGQYRPGQKEIAVVFRVGGKDRTKQEMLVTLAHEHAHSYCQRTGIIRNISSHYQSNRHHHKVFQVYFGLMVHFLMTKGYLTLEEFRECWTRKYE